MKSDAARHLKSTMLSVEHHFTTQDIGERFGGSDSMFQAATLLAMADSVKGYSWCQHCAYIRDHLSPSERAGVIAFVETILGHLKYQETGAGQ